MNDIADLPNIPLERLSVRELELLMANARQSGRRAMAEMVARELLRRGRKVPEELAAAIQSPTTRNAPTWPLGLAASIVGLVALSAGGWLLYGDRIAAPRAAAPATLAQTETETASVPAAAPATGPGPIAPQRTTSRLASRAPALPDGVASRARPPLPTEPSETSQTRRGLADGGRLAMARTDPGVLAGAAGGPELLAVSGTEVERASDCAAAASASETMLCNDALRVARNERRGRISPAPARIVVARNMPALPSLAGGRR